ncbi:uncharacterized protein LOC128670253 [Plodia interpunctella]|uniref:uncharacterized protein LOC128670253 n=1 Tax=Plodia interpunctella TaxID=58824 RepID=UPI002367AB41|nr:uncharacterized protein LOC128670253 [Plodia interpunctella]
MLVLSLLVLTAGLALAYEEYDVDQAEVLFEQFIQEYNRVYKDDEEKQMRFNIFKSHLHVINKHNKVHGYNVLGINQFADISKEEFANTHFGYRPNEVGDGSPCTSSKLRITAKDVPESFDWRDKGVVTDVKNQDGCGACWAFSTIGNVESQYAKVHGAENLISLSEQQLVDCDTTDHNCGGGAMENALLYFVNSGGGVMSEQDYPYLGKFGQCTFDQNKARVNVTGCVDFTNTPEEDIKEILVNNGPLAVALGVDINFKFYRGGILRTCDPNIKYNHALLIVGYGSENGVPYWIIKNSWGDEYGEKGYIRLIRSNPDCRVGKCQLVSAQVA